MPLEVSTDKVICTRCGMQYGRRKGNFPVSYAILYKGIGYTGVCKKCVDKIYEDYLAQCDDPKKAVRQVCRKLDLYWNNSLYEQTAKKAAQHSMMTQYMAKLTGASMAGRSYDDTLAAEGTLWHFGDFTEEEEAELRERVMASSQTLDGIPESVIAFWGPGYDADMYTELEKRYAHWIENLPKDVERDAGTEGIIRQICSLELDINRNRAKGKSVERSVNTLNALLGSANLKPNQRAQEEQDASLESTPLGVWLQRYENKRPLPDEYDDSQLLKYVFTWMGHLCKMLGLKDNKYTRLYEEAVRKYTVEKPEYDGDDDWILGDDERMNYPEEQDEQPV